MCVSHVAYVVLCVRFASLVRILQQSKPLATLRRTRNTRYGWLARPCPTETFNLQDASSFACRANVKLRSMLVIDFQFSPLPCTPDNKQHRRNFYSRKKHVRKTCISAAYDPKNGYHPCDNVCQTICPIF